MAQDFSQPVMTNGVGRALLCGKFTTANGTVPTGVTGEGFSVARTAEGRFTVTISSDPLPSQIVSVLVNCHREDQPGGTTTGTNELTQCYIDQDSLTASVFEVRLYTTADISAGVIALDDRPGAEIHFQAFVQYAGSNSD